MGEGAADQGAAGQEGSQARTRSLAAGVPEEEGWGPPGAPLRLGSEGDADDFVNLESLTPPIGVAM
jgi:hypothetical protein